jgi:mercuric ion transport protein
VVRKALGILVGLTAFLACPCHLPVTLPLLLGLLAWTPLAGAFQANPGLLVLGALFYFVFGLVLAVRLLSEKPQKAGADACCEPRPREAARRGAGQRA